MNGKKTTPATSLANALLPINRDRLSFGRRKEGK